MTQPLVSNPSTDIVVDDWEPGIRRITINRAPLRNAYRTQTAIEITSAIAQFTADDTARVLIITGAGGAFCAGGDLTSTYETEHAAAVEFGHGVVIREGMHSVIRALAICEKPVIAMISGPAVAGGLALALACDIRIADATARLGDTSGRVGLLPDEGGAWLFSHAMGTDQALKMLWGNEIYDAQQALELGLLTEVVDDAASATLALARKFAATAPLTTRIVKRLVRNAGVQTLDQSLREAEYAVEIINHTADVAEGISAFVGKRTPKFSGR
ncbi:MULTISPECIES: enoyl-CoA hydratase/isomerase family protein [Gordonia]|jgi:enoyl-CoA hydratase/carnithine racemase|uniref:enoyl-CoA hydratase/isomerase family protein n=1 Tax=Gordonia oleivorans TaxID=3156618 RepID=UPI0032B3235D